MLTLPQRWGGGAYLKRVNDGREDVGFLAYIAVTLRFWLKDTDGITSGVRGVRRAHHIQLSSRLCFPLGGLGDPVGEDRAGRAHRGPAHQ